MGFYKSRDLHHEFHEPQYFHPQLLILNVLRFRDKNCILKHILWFLSLLLIFYDYFSQHNSIFAHASKISCQVYWK